MIIIFLISACIIFWANIGYPISVFILGKLIPKKNNGINNNTPTVTVMVVAHNEEKVIKEKLYNLKELNYPKDKIEILVSSDNSTDNTNRIVEEFIHENPDARIRLYLVKERKGKTNAQNEAQKLVNTEFLVMTDANSMLHKNAVRELINSFTSDNISYVTGQLQYINSDMSNTSMSESSYWNLDLAIREIESRIQTITAGNGALYACRNSEYVDFNPIESHDSAMPIYFALNEKRALANHKAIAFEKAGENDEDEFNRKVRMNRVLLKHILPSFKILNVFKYKWFTFFYLGHRTARYLLWLAHFGLLISNISLAIHSLFFKIILVGHLGVFVCAILYHFTKLNNKIVSFIYYYCLTIAAQIVGIVKILKGEAKPFWEKAESTR